MLIKLIPSATAPPTPTILFALAFPDLPQSLPLPPAWATQLARLAADDLEAPPALHALDRAAALPALLQEVLFDVPAAQVTCTFLDGAAEEWALDERGRAMLARVVSDVEESGRAEERARARAGAGASARERAAAEAEAEAEAETERDRERQREREREAAVEREREREAELDREYDAAREMVQTAKGKGKEQSLNSPPGSMKRPKPKTRLHRSRSLLQALVATFSSSNSCPPSSSTPTSSSNSSPPPATRSSLSGSYPRSASPLRAFARRASFSALSAAARASASDTPPSPDPSPTPRAPSPPTPPLSPHNLETPPGSAPPSAPSSAFAKQQQQGLPLTLHPQSEQLTPRALRRRARSTLVDAFRAHVLPELSVRVGLFEGASLGVPHEEAGEEGAGRDHEGEDADTASAVKAEPGGGYHAWVARSMLRRAEARMRELEGAWPALARAAARRMYGSAPSPHAVSYAPFSSPASPGSDAGSSFFTASSPRHATFEPWSSSEESSEGEVSDSGDDEGDEGDESDYDSRRSEGGDSGETESDGSSVHTPESGHSLPYRVEHGTGHGHALEASTSTTSSYFTCSDPDEAGAQEPPPSVPSHIRNPAQSSPVHSRGPSHTRRASSAQRAAKRDERERRRAQRAAKAEHTAFARMTARLRGLLAQGAATRGLVQMQRAEGERVREARAVRRGWLDGGRAKMANDGGGAGMVQVQVQVFRPSGLGRGTWGPADVLQIESEGESEFEGDGGSAHGHDRPPAYEDVVATGFPHHQRVHHTRPSAPIQRTRNVLAHLEDIELEVDLERLEIDSAELEGLDIEVDLGHLELTDALDVDAMGLDIEVDVDMDFRNVDVFAGMRGGKGKGRMVPVNVNTMGRREVGREVFGFNTRILTISNDIFICIFGDSIHSVTHIDSFPTNSTVSLKPNIPQHYNDFTRLFIHLSIHHPFSLDSNNPNPF